MYKFPRTPHLEGSRFQHGDCDIAAISFKELEGNHFVVEEKIDGGQFGVSFEGGEMKLQSRGHYLRGGPREKQFEVLKQWAATHEAALRELLGERYVMYGENMTACHTIWYDQLPHYFMEFDVYDKERGVFLSTPARDSLLRGPGAGVRIVPVRVLAVGYVASLEELRSMIGPSAFISDRAKTMFVEAADRAYPGISQNVDRLEALAEKYYTGRTMEGLYVKWEEGRVVKGRYKFVRGDFVSHVAGQDEHWHDRPILQNQLAPGTLEKMFEQA